MSLPVEDEAAAKTVDEDEDIVNPWTVVGHSDTGIDYDKLIRMLILFHTFFMIYFIN